MMFSDVIARRLGWSAMLFAIVLVGPGSPGWAADPDAKPAEAELPAESELPADPEQFHLFLLVGQSNMAGRGKISDADRKPIARVLSLDAQRRWVPAIAPLHFDKPKVVGVGLGRSFASEYAKRHPGITVGLIPCAVGGTPIRDWQPGGFHEQTQSHPWDDMLARVQPTLNQGVLKGILWHQGEGDSKTAADGSYEENLVELIERFRKELGSPQVPFLIGQLGQFADRPWSDGRRLVDLAHRNVTNILPRTAFVPSDGLDHKGDQTHFDSPSLREFGVRYDAALRWIETLTPVHTLAPDETHPRKSEGDFIRLADGRVRHVYTRFEAGTSDHAAATLVSRISEENGDTWSDEDVLVVANEGAMNVMSVSLLRLEDNRIALFYLRKNSLSDCRPVVRFSSDETQTWSDPVEIIPESQPGYYVLNNDRVIQLRDGRLVVPVALHKTPDQDKSDWMGRVTCFTSDDAGQTWQRSETLQSATDATGKRVAAQEPGVIERQDGSLWMWVRSDAGVQYQATSDDRGDSWSVLTPSTLASPLSPASIERIPATGDWLAVWNDHRMADSVGRGRTPLSIAISSDEGQTWSDSIAIDSDSNGWYCYTAIDFVDDSVLLGHVAGRQVKGQELSTSVIRKLPLAQIYQQVRPFRIERVQRIGDQARHNAFTDLIRFEDQWVAVYREGSGHVSRDGALRVLVSDDAVEWSSAALITHPEADLRDAKLSITPEGDLMLSGAGAFPPDAGIRHQSMAWFSKNARDWSEMVEIGPANYWLWRTTFEGADGFSIGYSTGSADDRHVSLFRSQDNGRTFETLIDRTFESDYPNESSILFEDDGRAICLLRRDHGTKTAMFGQATAPYDNWQWSDTRTRVGGPHLLALPDGRVVAAVRLYDQRVRTSLCWINRQTGQLTEFLALPSGGDTSYAGLVWHDDALWVSYYSAHEIGKTAFTTAVYLARVRAHVSAGSRGRD